MGVFLFGVGVFGLCGGLLGYLLVVWGVGGLWVGFLGGCVGVVGVFEECVLVGVGGGCLLFVVCVRVCVC